MQFYLYLANCPPRSACVGDGDLNLIFMRQLMLCYLHSMGHCKIFHTSLVTERRANGGDISSFPNHHYTFLPANVPRSILDIYLLTPWSRVLLEKLTGSAASQIPPIFGTRRFLTVLTSARHLSLS